MRSASVTVSGHRDNNEVRSNTLFSIFFFNQGYRISTTGQAAPKFTVKLFYQGRQHNNSKASIAKLYSYSLNRIKI
jgi:hypothetical protein